MDEIRIKLEHEEYIKLKSKAEHDKVFVSELVRKIIKAWFNGCEKSITVIKKRSETKIKEGKFRERMKYMSRRISKYNTYAMDVIVMKEEKNRSPEDTLEDIRLLVSMLEEELDELPKVDEEYKHLFSLKKHLENSDFDTIKKIIDYKTMRWKWIICGKLKPTRMEATVLEQRLQEVDSQKRILKDRTKL